MPESEEQSEQKKDDRVDIYALLKEIIEEHSKTNKADGIIRQFSAFDPNNVEKLTEILQNAGLRRGDIYNVIETWANTREVDIPESIKDKLSPKDKKKAGDAEEGDEETDDIMDMTKKLTEEEIQAEKRAFAQLKLQEQKIKIQMRIKEMEYRLSSMDGKPKPGVDESGHAKPAYTIKKRTVKPRFDAEQMDFVRDKDGQLVTDLEEEEIPFDAHGRPLISGGTTVQQDPMIQLATTMGMFSKMMELMRPHGVSDEDKKKIQELEMAKIKNEFDKELLKMKADSDGKYGELVKVLEKKEMLDEVGQIIGGLHKEIEKLKEDKDKSKEEKAITEQTKAVKEMKDDLKETTKDIKQDVKSVIDTMMQEAKEEKAHKRKIEYVARAKAAGVPEEQIKREIERQEKIPTVTAEDMIKEMEKAGVDVSVLKSKAEASTGMTVEVRGE